MKNVKISRDLASLTKEQMERQMMQMFAIMDKLEAKVSWYEEQYRLGRAQRFGPSSEQTLPATRYEYADWADAKVAFNYHIEYQGFFYSVHYSNIGKISRVRATASVIEIFVDGERIAAHKRNFHTFKRYTTLPEHMPESHKAVTGWSSERYLSCAEKIGPKTRQLVANILDSRDYPVQTYRACMGIMRLASDYPAETMEAASGEAIDKGTCTYKYFSIILRQKVLKESFEGEKVVSNTNLRGAKAYAGGGMNA